MDVSILGVSTCNLEVTVTESSKGHASLASGRYRQLHDTGQSRERYVLRRSDGKL